MIGEIKEDFLHYVWKYKLFSSDIVTTKNELITSIKSGDYNTNSGPDFLNTQLKIDNQTWVGNVEIHVKSSDWYLHNHEKDKNYDAVILHVVYEDDAEVFMKNNKPLPTLVLKDKIEESIFDNYQKLMSKEIRWIPCDNQITTVDSFLLNNWLERLYFDRLESKAIFIKKLLDETNNDYEAVLFQLLLKNFGLKVNADAFFNLSKSIDFSIIRKERFDEWTLSALLFGQAGFLDVDYENQYLQLLRAEYRFLKSKYNLVPIANEQFQFFRMRPNNFPTIRIAQMIVLFHKHPNLFSKLIRLKKLKDFYSLLSVEVNDFWKSHYTFEKESKTTSKKLTKSFIDLLLVNTIIPLKFVYEQSRGELNQEELLMLIKQVRPEKNSIISRFSKLNISAQNAFESQALLQLKNEYCKVKKCLQCAVGNSLLKT